MQEYLKKSIPSLNQNKLNGLLAEIEFRNYLSEIGLHDRVSVGGWIARTKGVDIFGNNTIVMFPEIIRPETDYGPNRNLPEPARGLHTICSTFHQIGIRSLFCAPIIVINENAESVIWKSVQLGVPTQHEYEDFPDNLIGFEKRKSKYNFLQYGNKNVENKKVIKDIPELALADEFTKENIKVCFQNILMAEISDIDGILWGEQYTYPLEIKEKTAASDRDMGEYFGLDVGPFVKLAYYASKKGNLHSLFIVREIDNTADRNLLNWWFITFDKLAAYASWNSRGGGKSMMGGASTVVRIPKNQFTEMNADSLINLK